MGADLLDGTRESSLFISMLSRPVAEVGIGCIYSILETLAEQYELDDATVVLFAEPLGTQVFHLKQDAQRAFDTATHALAPGLYCEPEVIETAVKEAVCNFCNLALSLHLARYCADRDPLTNIANRRQFDVALRTAAAQSSRYGWVFTLLMLDLDGLKAVNDGAGHAAGDSALRDFGHALRRSARSGDTTARIGGDEFAVILGNAEGAEVMAFVDRLRSGVSQRSDPISFSVGAASAPRDSTDPLELCRIADARLYEDKDRRSR